MQGADGWMQGNLTGFFNETCLISAWQHVQSAWGFQPCRWKHGIL